MLAGGQEHVWRTLSQPVGVGRQPCAPHWAVRVAHTSACFSERRHPCLPSLNRLSHKPHSPRQLHRHQLGSLINTQPMSVTPVTPELTRLSHRCTAHNISYTTPPTRLSYKRTARVTYTSTNQVFSRAHNPLSVTPAPTRLSYKCTARVTYTGTDRAFL